MEKSKKSKKSKTPRAPRDRRSLTFDAETDELLTDLVNRHEERTTWWKPTRAAVTRLALELLKEKMDIEEKSGVINNIEEVKSGLELYGSTELLDLIHTAIRVLNTRELASEKGEFYKFFQEILANQCTDTDIIRYCGDKGISRDTQETLRVILQSREKNNGGTNKKSSSNQSSR